MTRNSNKHHPQHPPPVTPTAFKRPASGDGEEREMHGGVNLEEATRVRAYQLWERAGHPPGNGVSFWLEAETELLTPG
jgi:hypothetical protein